jgi:PAS domain S-box-containing protein
LVIDSARDYAIFTMDAAGKVTTWNSGAERILGYTAEQIIGRSGDVIFTPEDQAAGAPEEERTRAIASGRAEDERWHMRQNGSRFWSSGILAPLDDPSLGFVKILRDRTEQYQAEARLRESEARFRMLASNIPQLVFLGRNNGERTWPSPQWCVFTGQTFDESLGTGWLDAVHPEDREATLKAWSDARSKGEYYVEHRVRRSTDGEYRWHQTRAKPLADDPNTAEWVGTMTDIHELRELHNHQQVLLAELQHRTRNLLALVQSLARETIRMSDSFETFESEFVSRLAALSRVQGFLARSASDRVDVLALVAAELEAYKAGKDEGDIRIEGPSVPLPGAAAQTIALAIHELATNAAKYGALKHPAGKIDVRWQVAADPAARRLELEWRERGVQLAGKPPREGFGTVLIRRALPYQLKAETNLEFTPEGVQCTISIPIPEDDFRN